MYKTNQEAVRVYAPDVMYKRDDDAQKEPLPSTDTAALWEKCPSCGSVLYVEDLDANLRVCPDCNYHYRLSAKDRIRITADEGSFEEINPNLSGTDPLSFPGYAEKMAATEQKYDTNEAIITGTCTIGGNPCVLAVMDGYFIMGSMGAAVGEKFALAAERALADRVPLIAFTVSGGARMQEGLVSLLQMSKTSAVLTRLDEAGIPYFVVLTDPTTGGVTASFGMLGDITIAEPGALVGFAGRRVVEQTVRQTLPPDFQHSEFLLEKGFVDAIVSRGELKDTLSNILALHKEEVATA